MATVSARALIIRAPILGSLAQNGTSPQRRVSSRRTPRVSRAACTSWVGAMLWLGSKATPGSGALALKNRASSSGGVLETKRPHMPANLPRRVRQWAWEVTLRPALSVHAI